jgi:2-iminobutanoate/2-iminopropanoate deaminase
MEILYLCMSKHCILYKINDTMKRIIASPLAPKAVGPYSQAVEGGSTLYISGQLPIDASTGKMPETIEEQTRQALTNLGYIAAEAGYTLADAVKVSVLLDDIADFAAMNGVYATFFTENMPARVCYEVAKLPMGAKVEIDAILCK